MKLMFVGDIVGAVGRKIVNDHVLRLRQEEQIDIVIANGENAAHGKGITEKIYKQLKQNGIDVVTMGNHTFSKETIYSFIEDASHLIRPINLEPLSPGQNYKIVEVNNKKLCICNIMCEVFMHNVVESPFDSMDKILDSVEADWYFVDLHGEATSEKTAFAHMYKDKVQIVVGTHTHVQTADERIIGSCAYISDVGMCGAYDSIIGRDVEEILYRFKTKGKTRFTVAEGEGQFCAVIIEIDEITNQATSIKRIQIRPN